MKIVVTYEKKDILRLVQQDMKAQGLRLKAGTALEYKGALEIRFSVDTEDEPAVPESPAAAVKEETAPVVTSAPEEESVNMKTILGASKQMVMTQTGKFEQKPRRALAKTEMMEESEEYPKG